MPIKMQILEKPNVKCMGFFFFSEYHCLMRSAGTGTTGIGEDFLDLWVQPLPFCVWRCKEGGTMIWVKWVSKCAGLMGRADVHNERALKMQGTVALKMQRC